MELVLEKDLCFEKCFYFGKGFIFWKIIYIFEKGFSFWKIFSEGPLMLIPWLVKEKFPQKGFWWKSQKYLVKNSLDGFFFNNKNLISFWWKFPKIFFLIENLIRFLWEKKKKKKTPRSQEGFFFSENLMSF